MQIANYRLFNRIALPFPLRANRKQANRSVITANLNDIQANRSDIQAYRSAEFDCD